MPTIRAQPPSAAEPEPHRARDFAESFGADPARYDRTRPRYPDALVDRIIASSPGPDVLDVGIGTGISARPFDAAGCHIVGVEVDPRMAAFARRRGFEVEVARFEQWDPAGRTFDAVIAGQTWHWVDPIAGAAKAGALLRPGGRLAVFWNVQQPPPELAPALGDAYRRVLPDTPFAGGRASTNDHDPYGPILDATADGIRAARAFDEPERWRCDWTQPYTKQEWLEQVPTFGGISRITPARLDELLAGIGAAIDLIGGSFTMQYAAVAVTATRHGSTA